MLLPAYCLLPTAYCLLIAGVGYPHMPPWANGLIALWLWCFGANVGSFMNVVIFRVPEGLSVVHPGSRCPKCLNHIRWYDNIPVISWLILRAKCRYCSLPISSRYPTIEAVVAAVFLVVAAVGPPTRGNNLPYVTEYDWGAMDAALWLIYAYHMLLVTTLICAAMIRYDGHLTPRRLYIPALAIGLIAPIIWALPLVKARFPYAWLPLHPVAFDGLGHMPGATTQHMSPLLAASLNGLAGLAVGLSLGWLVAAIGKPTRRRLATQEVAAVGLCGLFLGWQAACLLAAAAALCDLLTALVSRVVPRLARIPWTGHLVSLLVLYLIAWHWLVERFAWLGMEATMATFGVSALIVGVASLISSSIAESTPLKPPHDPESDSAPGDASMSQPIEGNLYGILNSPSYRLAEDDADFLTRPELRPVRLQLELLKPELILTEQGVESTIVVFGGTQIVPPAAAEERLADAQATAAANPGDPQAKRAVERAERVLAKSPYYDASREFSRLVSSVCQNNQHCDYVVMTGGGPGIMEAANRGAYDVGAKSIGLNITLPHEQAPNPYITPELCFQFHYFALRKMHFLLRAKALVVFPGGFGTLDELFNTLTLRQTECMQQIPIILFGKEYWNNVINFQFLADEGVIADEHLDLIDYAETPEEAWEIIAGFHGDVPHDEQA
jgi:uncharacterized protein (TIGR00730 family)